MRDLCDRELRWPLLSFLVPVALSVWGAFNAGAGALEYLATGDGWGPWYVGSSFLHVVTIAFLWALWRIRRARMLRARVTRRPPDRVG